MRLKFPSLSQSALKTLTQSVMHFAVAISVAYTLHERAWARAGRPARANAAAGI